MKNLVVKLVETEEERAAAFDIRRRVFVQEQGVPIEEELDEHDGAAIHAIAILDGVPVGTARVVYHSSGDASAQASGDTPQPAEARIGRMAVDREWRRRGIAGRMLRALEDAARQKGTAEATLHAQTYVKALYAGHGYVEEGEVFLEAGIAHIQMRKRL